MTLLRQQMIDAMQLRGMALKTQTTYLYSVSCLSRYYKRSPTQIKPQEIQDWILWRIQTCNNSPSTCRLHFNGK